MSTDERHPRVADESIDPAGLDAFASSALTGAGWQVDLAPVFLLDVVDDSEFACWHEGATGVIHLHPLLLSRWHVLHELAHWVDNRDGHGPRFCANFLMLVRAGIGEDAERALLDAFEEFGVDVDVGWLTNYNA